MTNSPPSSSEESAIFHRLHPIVQRWIWDKGWTELRDIQAAAIKAVLDLTNDIIIAAATAAGKTEAAFLPILSALGPDGEEGVQALYVGPLKALINDQFMRLEDLCERLNMPVVKWHGDAPQAAKQRARKQPGGVILITPESIEAMFVRRPNDINRMFAKLKFIVIDELHAFLDGERGVHLASLLKRLESRIGQRPRRIGLSATLGDISVGARWLNSIDPDFVTVLTSKSSGNELKLQLRGVIQPALRHEGQSEPDSVDEKIQSASKDSMATALGEVTEHLFSVLRGRGNHLVFAGSRRRVEEVADDLRDRCESANLPNEFFPHHGNLAREGREALENRLKEGRLPTTAVATTTLELGIDIGSVESIAQIGAPRSIAALRQRLGRSGRRPGIPSVMRIYVIEPELTANSDPIDRLRLETVQAIAAVRLLIEHWIEPPDERTLHFSTLLHQILSVITERGGARAASLFSVLCGSGPFASVSRSLFAELLRAMAATEPPLLEQAQDGTLMLGPLGERIVEGHDFYAVFTTPDEYRIVTGTRTLGTLSTENALGPDDYLIFAGRRWRVRDVDERIKIIYVESAPSGRVPKFEGGEGSPLHDRLVQEMLMVYQGTDVPPFLNMQAQDYLLEARAAFQAFRLDRISIMTDDKRIHLFPWCGTKGLDTLRLALKREGIPSTPFPVGLTIDARAKGELSDALIRLAKEAAPNPMDLACDVRTLSNAKYDYLLTDTLLQKAFAVDRLDVRRLPDLARRLLSVGIAANAD